MPVQAPSSKVRSPRPLGVRLAGAVAFILGLLLLGVVMAADIGGTPTLERLALRLGLATAPLLEGFGIALSLTGGWLLWGRRA